MRRATGWIAAAVLAAGVGGCAEDQPAVCDSLDAARATVQQIQRSSLAENGLNHMQTLLWTLEEDLRQLYTDAKAQYAAEAEQLRAAAAQLRSSVDVAKADPGGGTVAAVRASMTAVRTSTQQLADSMQQTC